MITTPKCDTATRTCTKSSQTTQNAECKNLACVPKQATCRTSHCDCPQGQVCYNGKCIATTYPYYCCENKGCPAGNRCVSRTGTPEYCPVLCKGPCDCPEGQGCVNGKCAQASTPVFCCDKPQACPAGVTCYDKNNKAGTCPTAPRPCKTNCDCVQGESCTNGTCQKGAKPAYCCEKTGCPVGQGCSSKAGLSGICPKACIYHCDCDQNTACVNGLCRKDLPVGNVYCCEKPGCPLGQFCYQKNGQYNRCPRKQCTTACDCSQGEDCRNGTCVGVQPPVYCCDKANCPSGTACKDKAGKWSTCKAAPPACKSPCDCRQGQDCYQGQCVGVFPAVYCCDNVGCPTGQTCYDKNNKAGTCKGITCKNACDCPVQGQSCVRGTCVYLQGTSRVYCCDKQYCPAGHKCEDKQGTLKTCSVQSCKTPCDCKQGEDCRNGSCILVSPAVYCCSKVGCPQRASCYRTDGTQAQCGGFFP